MHLMIFYPGGVSSGFVSDDASDNEIYDTLHIAATVEEGNGSGKTSKHRKVMDERPGRQVWDISRDR